MRPLKPSPKKQLRSLSLRRGDLKTWQLLDSEAATRLERALCLRAGRGWRSSIQGSWHRAQLWDGQRSLGLGPWALGARSDWL